MNKLGRVLASSPVIPALLLGGAPPAQQRHATGLLPAYPSLDELQPWSTLEGAVDTERVYADEGKGTLASEFETRLASLIEGQRVLFVGESHWNVGVNRLFHRVLDALLARGRVETVFLELNYSFSAHYDHYVRLADDREAEVFLAEKLHPLVSMEGNLELLELLRRWNREHPREPVHVACLDLEWLTPLVIENIVEPYFRGLDPDFRLWPPLLTTPGGREVQFQRLRRMLGEAEQAEYAHPFLTQRFMANVVTNLEDTFGLEDHMKDRQVAIVRNVTEFHAARLAQGLAVFKGGGFHAVKRSPGNEGFWREAAYLDQVYAPTRGRVATLKLVGLGYGFAEVADLDPRKRFRSADNYHAFLRRFLEARARGKASTEQYYRLESDPLDGVECLVALSGYRTDTNVLRLVRVDAEQVGRPLTEDFDEVVYVLRSSLERTRTRDFEPGD